MENTEEVLLDKIALDAEIAPVSIATTRQNSPDRIFLEKLFLDAISSEGYRTHFESVNYFCLPGAARNEVSFQKANFAVGNILFSC